MNLISQKMSKHGRIACGEIELDWWNTRPACEKLPGIHVVQY